MSKTSALGANARAQQEFLDRYQRLLAWALKLSGRRDVDAHDLVHEAFVAYAEGQREDQIRNLNGYLYGILRNLLRADRRRAERRVTVPWDVAETTPEALCDRGANAGAQIEARDTLLQIARFARERAQHSKSGSALLLRYFHGYTPREIARIMRVQPSNVDDWLKLGRREARSAVAERSSPAAQGDDDVPSVVRPFPQRHRSPVTAGPVDSVIELRSQIFRQPPGRCLPGWRLKRSYQSQPPMPIDTARLAHIVTCAACLDRVSDRLGFPGPSARHPVDTLISSARRDSQTVRRAMAAGAVIVFIVLALGPGRAAAAASASALIRAASAIAASVSTWLTSSAVWTRPLPAGRTPPLAPLPGAPERRSPAGSPAPARIADAAIPEGAALVLQLEALALLDRRGLLLGRELTLTRDSAGRVRLVTLATSVDERKMLEAALAPLARTRDFAHDVHTLGDATRNANHTVETQVIVRDVELRQAPTPILDAIRRRLPEPEVWQVVNRALDGSRQSLLHAALMLDLVQRFDRDALRIANPAAYTTFETMIRYHALAFARATERVRRTLESASSVALPTEAPIDDVPPPGSVRELVARLRDLALLHDQTLGISLAATPSLEVHRLVEVDALLASLRLAERFAEHLAGL